MEKATRYNGKTLSLSHNPGEGIRFNTEDFFNILTINPDYYIAASERHFIDFNVAINYADRNDEIFAQWLRDNYEDSE